MCSLARSTKKTPGSPVFHAPSTIESKTSLALSRPFTSPVRGVIRSYSAPSATASMKASVTATEMLKLVIWDVSFLQRTNRRMSGWSTRRMPMLAPRRVPPCFTTSVEASYRLMNETGPDATPMVERTVSPSGRRRENEKPVPPPDWWTRAIARSVS